MFCCYSFGRTKPDACSVLLLHTKAIPQTSRTSCVFGKSHFVSAGLDSFTASEVMEVVKGLVSSGITIAATIHTPTSRTFQLFDRVLILQRGRIVYFGDNGEAATNYFSSSPYFEVLCRAVLCCAVQV